MKMLICAVSFFMIGIGFAAADIVELANGNVLEGEISNESEQDLVLQNNIIKITINKSDIVRIEKKSYVHPETAVINNLPKEIPPKTGPSSVQEIKIGTDEVKQAPQTGDIEIAYDGKAHPAYIPASYTGEKEIPLILCLAGSFTSGNTYISLWKKAAEKYGYALVAPNSNNVEGWGHKGDYEMVIGVLNELIRRYEIDRKRFYLAGFSGGGKFVYYLLGANPDVYTGLASICGCMIPNARKNLEKVDRDIPFYILNGEIDNIVPPNLGKQTADSLKKMGFNHVNYMEAPGIGHDQPSSIAFKIIEYFQENEQKANHPAKGQSQGKIGFGGVR